MTRKMIIAVVVLLSCLVAIVLGANVKPNFSGVWIMDRDRSLGQPANVQQSMTVNQTEDQITVETKLTLPDSERIVKDTYILDGKEYDYTPPAPLNAPPNTPPAKGKRTVNWVPNASALLVTEVITNETPKGPSTTQVVRKWTFTGEGELTITNFVDTPTASYESKRIFLKK